MKSAFTIFRETDSGAVTVDWVVLTAALIGLGMLILIPVAFGTRSATHGVADYISSIEPGYENN